MNQLKPLALAIMGLSISNSAFAELEKITITATKREASVQETPIAVTALTADAIDRAGITDVRDLSALSTSFNSNSSNSETAGTTMRIRGVGTTGDNLGLESAVGVFLDGVYLSRPGIALADLVDVERIEVLRGPQGTLFGRNTSAGAISIITQKPSVDESDFWTNMTLGNYQTRNLQAGGTFAVVEDKLGLRFSVSKRDADGFATSVASGNDSGTRDRYSLRSQLLWLPQDNIEFKVIADYSDANEQCCDAVILAESPLALGGLYALAGLPGGAGVEAYGPQALEERQTNGSGSYSDTQQFGLSTQLNWSLGWADFTGIVSYRSFEAAANLDLDYVSIDVANTMDPRNINDIDTWSLELRLQGSTGKLDWMVGTYYADENIDAAQTMRLGKDFSAYLNGGLWFPLIIPDLTANFTAEQLADIVVSDEGMTLLDVISSANPAEAFAGATTEGAFAANEFSQQGRTLSLYSHNTFAVNDQWDMVFGFRWIDDKKDGQFAQRDNESQACLNTLGKVGAGLLPSDFGWFAAGFICIPFIAPADVPGTFLPQSFAQTFNNEALTYTVKSVYHINKDSSTYTSFTHGYKAGGFSLDPTAAIAGTDPTFASETTDAWEVGYKADLWQNRLRANLAVFHQQMDNFQVLEFTGIQVRTYNVPTVLSSGVELELLFNATDNLDLNLAFTYLDARYPDDCDNGNNADEPVSRLCGNDLTNAPDLVSVLGWHYEDNLSGTDLSFFLNGSLRYEDKRRTSIQAFDFNGVAVVQDWQNSNTKANLRVGLGGSDGDWTVELWGNNIFDKRTYSGTFDIPIRAGARGAFIDAPRTYGVTLRTAF